MNHLPLGILFKVAVPKKWKRLKSNREGGSKVMEDIDRKGESEMKTTFYMKIALFGEKGWSPALCINTSVANDNISNQFPQLPFSHKSIGKNQ